MKISYIFSLLLLSVCSSHCLATNATVVVPGKKNQAYYDCLRAAVDSGKTDEQARNECRKLLLQDKESSNPAGRLDRPKAGVTDSGGPTVAESAITLGWSAETTKDYNRCVDAEAANGFSRAVAEERCFRSAEAGEKASAPAGENSKGSGPVVSYSDEDPAIKLGWSSEDFRTFHACLQSEMAKGVSREDARGVCFRRMGAKKPASATGESQNDNKPGEEQPAGAAMENSLRRGSAAPFLPNLQSALTKLSLVSENGQWIGGRALQTATVYTTALAVAAALGRAILAGAAEDPELAVFLLPPSGPGELKIDLAALGINEERAHAFLVSPATAQKAACESEISLRSFCEGLEKLDFEIALADGKGA